MLESPFQSCGKPCSPHVTDEGNRGSERRKDFSQVLNKKEQTLWMTYGKAAWPGYVLHLHIGHANMEAGISLSTLVINHDREGVDWDAHSSVLPSWVR